MQYIEEILRLLTWPAGILASLYFSQLAIKKFDKFLPKENED